MFWNEGKNEKTVHIRDITDSSFDEIPDFDTAKKDPKGYIVFHGDDGGQIYLTVLAKRVRASEDDLKKLLLKIDARCWNDERTALVYFQRGTPEQEIAGGMGGGIFTKSLWVHPELEDMREMIAAELGLN